VGIDKKLVDEIVRRVLSVTRPDRIIVFGSAAEGTMDRDSDIDLLVLERAPSNTRDASVRIGNALRGLGYPFDVIVMATERFDETRDVIGGVAYPASKYGEVVYEAA
jgi:predicted nucleotidyltransferase